MNAFSVICRIMFTKDEVRIGDGRHYNPGIHLKKRAPYEGGAGALQAKLTLLLSRALTDDSGARGQTHGPFPSRELTWLPKNNAI
jgi:hypothetical protein